MALFALVRSPKGQLATRVAGLASVVIGGVMLVSWWGVVPLLSSSGFATVKPTTALCVAALGLAIVYPGRNSRLAFAVGLAVAAIAALGLLDLLGIDFGFNRLNRLLVPRAAVPGREPSFLTINGMPLALELAGVSLALGCFERHRFAATALSGIAGVMAIFALLNYLNGVHSLSIQTPTPLSAVGLLCVVGAIIFRTGTMPALRKPRPLWRLLIVLGCAVIAPLLLFGVYTGRRIADAELRDARNDLISSAGKLSADIDREIVGEIRKLRTLAASSSLRQGDFAEFQRQAEASLARQSGNIALVDRNMQELVNTWLTFNRPLPKTAVPETVERAFATGKPQVTGLFTGPVSKRLVYAIIVPVQIDGENRYALLRSPDQRALERVVATNKLPPGRQAVVSDGTHRVIVRSDQQGVFVAEELPRAQWYRAGPDGEFEFIDSEGRPSVEAYAWSELTGWKSAVWAPRALLEASVRTLWWTLVFMGVLALTLVVGLASWLGRLIARSVGQAAQAATTLGEGSPLPSDETPIAEVDTLMAELRRAAARRQAAEHDLQASKDNLQVALDAAQLGSWQYDPRHRVFSGDERAKEIFEFAENEAPLEEVMTRVNPDDAEKFLAAIEESLDPFDPKRSVTEFRLRRAHGEIRWVETLGLAHFDGTGPERRAVSFRGTVQDITERKERQEREHLLMREINHRAKNMLSVVGAIAHQTATRAPEDFIERFSERIRALAANQDLLVRNEWRGVDVEKLVRAQLAHFADLVGSRIAVDGSSLRLNAAAAQAIGLALHELATNAGKYGALSTEAGLVDVCWRLDGDVFAMSWTERNGPPVSPPKRQGFGTTVVDSMAKHTMGGEIQLDYAPSGLMWGLTCPAANALEP
jgi:PAS domain S-box-containing protein